MIRNKRAAEIMIFVICFWSPNPGARLRMTPASGLETGKDETKMDHEHIMCPAEERTELFKYV